MKFTSNSINMQPEILKRKLGGELFSEITLAAGAFTNNVCKAGTLIAADGSKAVLSGATKGVWTVQITAAFANDETIVIDGVTYTKKATESVADKQFEGVNAAAQITSLLKMVKCADFDVASVTGATDKLGFTQKVADGNGSAPTVTTTATTGAVGSVTQTTAPVTGTSNAVGVLYTDVSDDNPNGTLIKAFAVINESNAETNAGVAYSSADKAALSNLVFE